MTNKMEIIAKFKKDYPTLRSGDDERGYEDLSPAEYEATINAWADNQLANEAKTAAAEQAAIDKAALLAKLGINADELKILLT